jgi:hypothetical protein
MQAEYGRSGCFWWSLRMKRRWIDDFDSVLRVSISTVAVAVIPYVVLPVVEMQGK